MNTWDSDKRWSDRFLREIKAILGVHLIGDAPLGEDRYRNTDLIVLKLDAVRVACRIRRHCYMRYSDELTIRAGRPSGIKTELSKIIEGWGDYLFYGFANEEETGLEHWILGDLKAFRLWHMRSMANNNGIFPGKRQANEDMSSFFYAYKWKDIEGFLVGASFLKSHKGSELLGKW